jgi:hypothetical protein
MLTQFKFGHKLHIGMPYRGKRFWNHQIPTSCLPTKLVFIHIEHICTFTFFRRRNVFSDATEIIFSYFLAKCQSNKNKVNCDIMLTYDNPATSHDMGYLYEACDQIPAYTCHFHSIIIYKILKKKNYSSTSPI